MLWQLLLNARRLKYIYFHRDPTTESKGLEQGKLYFIEIKKELLHLPLLEVEYSDNFLRGVGGGGIKWQSFAFVLIACVQKFRKAKRRS